MNKIIQDFQKEQFIKRPKIKPGDIVAIYQEIEESGKKRTQIFKGVVLKIQGQGASKTFTVRRISFGVGIERTYPLYSPLISKIIISKSTKVRRAKLYYLRDKTGKSAKLKEKSVSDDVMKFLADQEKEEKVVKEQGAKNKEQETGNKEQKEEKK
jgi:large subunit ribosomal protein L19